MLCLYAVFVSEQYSKVTISCPPSCSPTKEKDPGKKAHCGRAPKWPWIRSIFDAPTPNCPSEECPFKYSCICSFIQLFVEPNLCSGNVLCTHDTQQIEWTKMPALTEPTFQHEVKFTQNKAST